MIRPAMTSDTVAILDLAGETGLFGPDALAELGQMLRDHLGDGPAGDHTWLIAEDEDEAGRVAGIAYVAPERMTSGTWNLYLIAVRADRQRQGRGAALVRAVERALTDRGGRLLLVETSGAPGFEPAWAFYHAAGFAREATIRDFYATSDDKIVFRKLLTAGA